MNDKNPFDQLKKKPKRGQGMGATAKPIVSNNTKKPEKSQAVKVAPTRRSYRVSTYISEESGQNIEALITQIREKEGKKPKIADIIERGIKALKAELR